MGMERFKTFNTYQMYTVMKNSPEHIPLYIQSMQVGGKIPDNDAIFLAADLCPKHIPVIYQAMLDGGVVPDSYVLESVKKHHPDLIK